MLKIVFIDDEYYFRNSMINGLPWAEYGFSVVGDANNGMSGLNLILKEQPDIAIIDINMPGLDGLELIERLSSQEVSCRYILLTGYSEFKYAQKALRLNVSEYILKPVNFTFLLESLNTLKEAILKERELSTHLKTLKEQRNRQMKENFLLDLLNGYFSFNESLLSSYLRDLDIRLPFHSYAVYLVKFPQLTSDALYELQAFLEDTLSETYLFEIFMIGHLQLCIIEETDTDIDTQAFVRHLRHVLDTTGHSCHLGVSTVHQGVEQIIGTYKEAERCMKNAISRNTFVQYGSQLNTTLYHITPEELNELKKEIRLRNLSQVQKYLSALYAKFRQQNLSYDNVIFCSYELLSCLISVLNEQQEVVCLSDSNAGGLFDSVNNFPSLKHLESWVTSLFTEHLTAPCESAHSVSKKVEQYIKEHYSNMDLSINVISQNLFLNYSYICCCFKKDFGITINDYINQVRMEKALVLFHSGHDNIGYVAEQTGFQNAGYFSKRFKKAFGLPPSEYIKTL